MSESKAVILGCAGKSLSKDEIDFYRSERPWGFILFARNIGETEQIRDLVITDKLGLGEQLSEQALAEQLGVSRTPVREAFLRLQTERLVEVKPQRGTFVFQYDTTELREANARGHAASFIR